MKTQKSGSEEMRTVLKTNHNHNQNGPSSLLNLLAVQAQLSKGICIFDQVGESQVPMENEITMSVQLANKVKHELCSAAEFPGRHLP